MTHDQDEQYGAAEKIKKVLAADLASYLDRDKTGWEQNWVKDDRFQSIMECGTMQVAHSYDAFRENVFAAMDAEPEAVDANVRIENLTIDVKGEMAWATFEEIVTNNASSFAVRSHSHNFRLFENTDGQWRILFHGCWAEPLRDTEGPALEVASDCRVLWQNAAAQKCLKSFGGLSVSNGVLRATKPSFNTGLREAVSGAHDLTGFGKFNQASQGQVSVTFPVVLGESDEGALVLCWVKVADGRVYILFGEDRDLNQQIEIAKVIYRLSDAQTELLRLIALGNDLAAASQALGISKNTTRTHLRRIYEKAGVGSQIELLRLLISFDV